MEHYLTHATSASDRSTDTQRSGAYGQASFLWLVESMHFPVLAYFHIFNRLPKRPNEGYADKAWAAMCDSYEAIANGPKNHRTRFSLPSNDPSEPPPRLVLDARMNVMQTGSSGPFAQRKSTGKQSVGLSLSPGMSTAGNTAVSPMVPTPLDLDGHDFWGRAQFHSPDTCGLLPRNIGPGVSWT
ncbi:hypothetical protein EMCG_00038 [[Emmonsia] crescens]|uniref:Uncharacterized protein n=1 Tax=[Emmonsia] crescens TaxID=73230 RepID=A0A0G2IDV1_9EURO|nr:hypothetical protein EMCG_00038 [Emmonsia crescens UAMH 3008]